MKYIYYREKLGSRLSLAPRSLRCAAGQWLAATVRPAAPRIKSASATPGFSEGTALCSLRPYQRTTLEEGVKKSMKETISHHLWPNLSFLATNIFVSWSDLLVLCGLFCCVRFLHLCCRSLSVAVAAS